MRKLILLLLLFTGMVNAQIVNIPDSNFKAKLLSSSPTVHVGSNVNPYSSSTPNIYTTIDINGDGEIQVSEAQEIVFLNLNSFFGAKISDLQGIDAFTNLNQIYCNSNNLTTLDIHNTNIQFLAFENNLLTTVNISGCNNLKQIDFYNNFISSIDFSGCHLINSLNLSHNQLATFDVNDLQDLWTLDLGSNNLSSFALTNKSLLVDLNLGYNQLTNVQLTNLPHLYKINVQNNLLTSVDFSSIAYLPSLNNIPNAFTLDVRCNNNINLVNINLKNGYNNDDIFISSASINNQIQYICRDEADVFTDSFVNTNSLFGTYCNFTPGGNYNTISGNVKFDNNNNGCDASDLVQPNIRVNINDSTNTGASFTNTAGDYKFYTQAGSFDLTPEIENPSFFNFTPSIATIPFANNNNNTSTQDFCIAANGVHTDLEVVLASIAPARPGFDATYKLVYKNKGNQTLSGSVNLVFDDAKTDFVSANPIVDNLAVNSLTWNYTSLLPFESRSIDVVLNVNSPLETPAVNIGDVLNFTATINPISGDELPDDNTFVYNQIVVGSFDPNDITCLEGNSVAPSEIGEYLHYVINFENTGNYPAENVVVKTIVDTTKFDVNSLQLLNTSNPVDARITGNVVEFIFENIQLGGPGGHGHILLKIKSENTLVAGDAVAKNANIYFDYNAPVDTGMVTTVFQSLSNTVFEKDDSINVSPNPTNGNININSNFNIKKIELYDVHGRILETQIGETKTLDISENTNGIYFLKITTEKGSKVEKVVKK